MSLFSLSTWSIFWAGWVKGIILGTWLLSFKKLGLIDKLLLEHVGLPHVLVLAVHMVNFIGWMSQGGHVMGGIVGWVAHVIIVSVQRIGFLGFLDLV